MKRTYHNYLNWEEYKFGMWRKVTANEEKDFLQKAIEFTGNHLLYGHAMKRVLIEWPISCEQNLTNPDINQKAWIGHAACCIALNCPEYIVRMAWHYLTKQQQDLANKQAEIAISSWMQHAKNNVQLTLFEEK